MTNVVKSMKEIKTKEEAVDFVFNQLHTCRVIDTTWDEYIELTLRLGLQNNTGFN